MNTNIEIETIKHHFFLKNRENDTFIQTSKYKTKLINQSFYSLNEVKICEKIKEIPYYYSHFLILNEYEPVNISQLNEEVLEKLHIRDDLKYLLFKYRNIDFVSFNDFLFNFTNPKKMIFYLIHLFLSIIKSLIELQNKNICFFNLSYKNIIIQGENTTLLKNFQLSLDRTQLNKDYINNILDKIPDFTLKPFEVHVLFYLMKNDIDTISYSFIEEICEIYIKNLAILTLFSENYKERYKLACIQSIEKYINKPKNVIINDILEKGSVTWDLYSLCYLFLYIFGNISRIFSLKDTFINKIVVILTKNIHPDPSKRGTLNELLEQFNNIIMTNENSDFLNITNHLDFNKIPILFDILGK
jgi:hypothetical protein